MKVAGWGPFTLEFEDADILLRSIGGKNILTLKISEAEGDQISTYITAKLEAEKKLKAERDAKAAEKKATFVYKALPPGQITPKQEEFKSSFVNPPKGKCGISPTSHNPGKGIITVFPRDNQKKGLFKGFPAPGKGGEIIVTGKYNRPDKDLAGDDINWDALRDEILKRHDEGLDEVDKSGGRLTGWSNVGGGGYD